MARATGIGYQDFEKIREAERQNCYDNAAGAE